MKKNEDQHCSFCGRPKSEVNILIAGQEGHICENCIGQAQQLIEDEMQHTGKKFKFSMSGIMKPRAIKEFLDGYVIGQE